MSHIVNCQRTGKEAEGLDKPPFPGPAGERIFQNISREAWQEWLKLQTMLINEHRLTPFEAEAKKFLASEREKFLFGGANVMPEGYRPPDA
jgi:Fe-S cluster biosynthesis and repair protein YggX